MTTSTNGISLAALLLRRGAELAADPSPQSPASPLDGLAQRLAALALAEGPLPVHAEGEDDTSELFDRAARLAAEPLGRRLAGLATLHQTERAVLYEFDGTGPLTGSRLVAALVRVGERPDLLDAYLAIGRLAGAAAEMTAVPAIIRLDAGDLARTLDLVGEAVQHSLNAASAALGHAAGVRPFAGMTEEPVPPALLEPFWHALRLAALRSA